MRTSLGLVSALALALTAGTVLSTGCSREFWNSFISDSPESCKNVGCAGGGTCNPTTGFCEGAPQDMGSVDMAPFSKGELFADPAPITGNLGISSQNYFQMSTMTQVSGTDKPYIYLSGLSSTVVRLVPTGFMLDYTASMLNLSPPPASDARPCFLTSVLSSTEGRRDLLAAQLGNQYLLVSGSGAMQTPRDTIPGFKLISIGDLNEDRFPDIVVTSSKLKAAQAIYGAAAAGDGRAEVYAVSSSYIHSKLNSPSMGPALDNNLISASIEHQAGKALSGFNIAMISENDVGIAIIGKLSPDGNNYTFTQRLQVPIPASDFAIPVDLDADGLNDLVLISQWDGMSGRTQPAGSVSVLRNLGTANSPSFDKARADTLPISGGLILGAYVADFDLDEVPDLTVMHSHMDGNDFLMYRNEAADPQMPQRRQLRFFGKMSVPFAPRRVEYVDVNRDGCKDMLMLASGPGYQDVNGTQLLVALGRRRGPGRELCQ